ncbi:recombinase family protein [Cellulosimicrobium funkei]|uniref:recombinase family protein n=1 Tax=Cellulosimicrobium funkei TaxID=264251 RepID=UPI0037DD88EB
MRAAVYTRASLDTTGEGLAVERQHEDCLRIINERGWTVAGEYQDNSISASKKGAKRPGYDRMVADYEAGLFDALVCWDLDRLTRQPRQLEDWIDRAEERGLRLVTANGEADLSTDGGRMYARIKASVARAEVERKGARQRRANDQRAQQGRPAAGPRPFGFDAGGLALRPREAELIRSGYQTVLAGGSLRSVARDWNASGLTTSKGNTWDSTNVRRVLRNPRNAGLRAHRGETIGTGEWEPIVDEQTYRAAMHVLDDPARSTVKDRSIKFLLTNIAECGRCDDGAKVATARTSRGKRTYKCRERGNLAREAAPIESYVEQIVLARLSRPDAIDLLRQDPQQDIDALRGQAQALRVQLDEAAALFASGQIRATQLATITRDVEARLESVEQGLAAAGQGNALSSVIGAEDVAAAWAGIDIMQQRAIVKVLFSRIVLDPVPQGAKRFRPESIRFEWRTA